MAGRKKDTEKEAATQAARDARIKVSNENMRNEAGMVAEMESSGKKVLRRDDMYCKAILVTPEIVHLSTLGLHGYYPNAVAELYELWRLENEGRQNQEA